MARRFATLPILVSAALLAGCWGMERPAIQSAPASTGPNGATAPAGLAGKWTLAIPGGGSCVMNFGAQPDATEGTIAPAGGCPSHISTGRKWSTSAAGLVIRDQKAETLAQLSPVGPDRYEGRTSDGQELTLSRE
jgi:hypothetical protein